MVVLPFCMAEVMTLSELLNGLPKVEVEGG